MLELRREMDALRAQISEMEARRDSLAADIVETNELFQLQEVGIYRYSHPLETSVAYRERLESIYEQIAAATKDGSAIVGTTKWAVNGSAKDGAKMVVDFQKLMLRTYNNEAENVVRTMKPHGLASGTKRLEKVRDTIKKLGAIMKVEITEKYHALRVEELSLTADYAQKLAEEKEREREERARLREEEAAQREMEREKEKLEKEKAHYLAVVEKLESKGGGTASIEAATLKLQEIDAAIEGVVRRAANTRAGYVYVISNHGAFGETVVKIGMTRRLEPMDRVRELGDASVPFRFDVHAIVFSDDAVGLETALHHRFATHRVNLVNMHREFFYVDASAVRDVLRELRRGDLLSFDPVAAAEEWRQSSAMRGKTREAPSLAHGDP